MRAPAGLDIAERPGGAFANPGARVRECGHERVGGGAGAAIAECPGGGGAHIFALVVLERGAERSGDGRIVLVTGEGPRGHLADALIGIVCDRVHEGISRDGGFREIVQAPGGDTAQPSAAVGAKDLGEQLGTLAGVVRVSGRGLIGERGVYRDVGRHGDRRVDLIDRDRVPRGQQACKRATKCCLVLNRK